MNQFKRRIEALERSKSYPVNTWESLTDKEIETAIPFLRRIISCRESGKLIITSKQEEALLPFLEKEAYKSMQATDHI